LVAWAKNFGGRVLDPPLSGRVKRFAPPCQGQPLVHRQEGWPGTWSHVPFESWGTSPLLAATLGGPASCVGQARLAGLGLLPHPSPIPAHPGALFPRCPWPPSCPRPTQAQRHTSHVLGRGLDVAWVARGALCCQGPSCPPPSPHAHPPSWPPTLVASIAALWAPPPRPCACPNRLPPQGSSAWAWVDVLAGWAPPGWGPGVPGHQVTHATPTPRLPRPWHGLGGPGAPCARCPTAHGWRLGPLNHVHTRFWPGCLLWQFLSHFAQVLSCTLEPML
jgi:hypothetical protein